MKTIIKFTLVSWALLSFCWLAGEPNTEMTATMFCIYKALGFISLALSCYTIKIANKKGIIKL